MSSGLCRKHTHAGVITSVLMSSRSSLGSTSSIARSSSPFSCFLMATRSFVRKSTRFLGSSFTTRVPSARVWTREFTGVSRAGVLDQDRDALAAADAGRGDAEALLAAPELQEERQDQARAGRAERVPERDRAAVDVDLVAVEAELLLDAEVLRREGLVDLEEVDVGELDARALEALPDRGHGPDAHLGGIYADRGRASHEPEHVEPVRLRALGRGHDEGGRAV